MGDNVLIVGSGGSNKYSYIKSLLELGANITVLDPEGENWWTDEDLSHVDVIMCPFNNLNEILEKAKLLHARKRFDIVDTIFELALEPAAEIRKYLDIKTVSSWRKDWSI
jgi:siroheme synthase (precorrin-2 oxidase/ferrochelatase)